MTFSGRRRFEPESVVSGAILRQIPLFVSRKASLNIRFFAGMMPLHFAKAAGDGARSPESSTLPASSFCQANKLKSFDVRRISSCKRKKALVPSPYRRGMFTPNIPSNEYVLSSILVVSRFAAHDIRCAMLYADGSVTHRASNKSLSMPVIVESCRAIVSRSLRNVHLAS